MPTPDDYGQGINIASLTDAPDANKLAKDIANAIAPRSIMRFASASARGATLTAPVEGMLTWLNDVNRLDLYDGTTWVAVSVGQSTWKTITPESPWTQNGNSNGTLQYRILNISGEESLQFRGALGRSSYPSSPPSNYVVNNTALPSAARPSTLRTVLIPCSDVSSDRIALKLDVRTDGYLEVFGFSSSVKPPWIGFNGVTVSL
ncbi:hypothetical protein [Streptomyces coeruleorubidus]|uniref:Uncharacterized protein n=1 Tax=Streptomyces coeruleorubidus TaxID=116188 RepID=A0A5J6HZW6_STRC4|nr:hypothetical protein [Streptomyces coeruleorubidus]QEV23943.1 hypothetical protein CP976_07145 [Streptomyces coeruleorubidus]GGT85959.1 hypothetical protein GCM10010256_52640 [Streptomyces coeruleorubidus]